MPVFWVIFLYFLLNDAYDVWRILLLNREPPLNPFFLESTLVFGLTLFSRFSLNIRRLHDQDRRVTWMLLPIVGLVGTVFLFFAFLGGMMNSSMTGLMNEPNTVASLSEAYRLMKENPPAFWSEMSLVAKAIQSNGWNTIPRLFADIYTSSGVVGLKHSIAQVVTGAAGYPEAVMFGSILFVGTPIVAFFWHVWIATLPSNVLDNAFGPAKLAEIRDRIKKTTLSDKRPMAGYAHLYRETQEERKESKKERSTEMKELYRDRVLGTVGASTNPDKTDWA